MTATLHRDAVVEQLQLGGRSIRVAHRAAADGLPPLLVMNGSRCNIEVLTPFLDALDPGSGYICFDPPGIGGSPRAMMPYRLTNMACLARAILGELDVPVADVLGVSWGGALAQQFAFQCGSRCRRLFLVSTGAAPFVRPSLGTLREAFFPRRFDPVRGREIAIAFYGGKVRHDPALLDLFRGGMTTDGGERFQSLAMLGWTSLPFLALIRQPTLVIHGDDDRLVPPMNGRLLARLLPHAELLVVDDGHLALVTSADEIGPAVEAFRRKEPA